MTAEDLDEVFEKKIAAARWLEANGNSRARHAAKITRYALESARADIEAIVFCGNRSDQFQLKLVA